MVKAGQVIQATDPKAVPPNLLGNAIVVYTDSELTVAQYPSGNYAVDISKFTLLGGISRDLGARLIDDCVAEEGGDVHVVPLIEFAPPGVYVRYRCDIYQGENRSKTEVLDFKSLVFFLRAQNLINEGHCKALIALANFYLNL